MTLITRVSSNFMAYLAFYKYVFTLLCIQGNILYWGKNMCLSRMILGKALRCLNAFGTYQCTYICDGAYTIGNSLSKCFIRRTLCFFRKWKDIQCVGCIYDYTDLQDAKYTCIKFFKQMVFGLPIMRINCWWLLDKCW